MPIFIPRYFLKRLIDTFCHHKKSIFGPFHIYHVWFSFVFSRLVSKILCSGSSGVSVHLDLHGHEIEDVIHLLQHLATPLFQRHLCILTTRISVDLVKSFLDVGLLHLHWHFLLGMEVKLEPVYSCLLSVRFVIINLLLRKLQQFLTVLFGVHEALIHIRARMSTRVALATLIVGVIHLLS